MQLLHQVAEAFLQCGDKERDELLYYLIAHHTGRTLVFTNAISGVQLRPSLLRSQLRLPAACSLDKLFPAQAGRSHAKQAGPQQTQFAAAECQETVTEAPHASLHSRTPRLCRVLP